MERTRTRRPHTSRSRDAAGAPRCVVTVRSGARRVAVDVDGPLRATTPAQHARPRRGLRARRLFIAVTLDNSTVHTLQAARGTLTLLGVNDLSLPPLNLLGAIGLPWILLALLLEALHL